MPQLRSNAVGCSLVERRARERAAPRLTDGTVFSWSELAAPPVKSPPEPARRSFAERARACCLRSERWLEQQRRAAPEVASSGSGGAHHPDDEVRGIWEKLELSELSISAISALRGLSVECNSEEIRYEWESFNDLGAYDGKMFKPEVQILNGAGELHAPTEDAY